MRAAVAATDDFYVFLTDWARRRDQMYIGATPALSNAAFARRHAI